MEKRRFYEQVSGAAWAGAGVSVGVWAGRERCDGGDVHGEKKLKEMAYAVEGDGAMAARLAINGSLALYLDFLNLFLFMLRILGSRRD